MKADSGYARLVLLENTPDPDVQQVGGEFGRDLAKAPASVVL